MRLEDQGNIAQMLAENEGKIDHQGNSDQCTGSIQFLTFLTFRLNGLNTELSC